MKTNYISAEQNRKSTARVLAWAIRNKNDKSPIIRDQAEKILKEKTEK